MLTVLLATLDRARLLREVLEAFCQLQVPASGWKLVVVDNGSTDGTREVLGSFANRLPLRAVSETRPGKNHALNAGLPMAEGDLTVLTDDDVFPRVDWLVQLRKAADAHPEYSMFGGAIVPRWEVPPPPWIEWLDLGPIFTLTPEGLKEGELSPTQVTLIQGPNMAVRTRIFQMGTRFDPSIGPRGTSYPMGSETDLLLRLRREGHRGWHVQGAVVEHFIRQEQIDKDWILRRAVRYGRGWCRMALKTPLWMGIPRHLFHDVPREAAFIAAAWALRKHRALLRARWRFNYMRGEAIEAGILARERRAKMPFKISVSGPEGDTRERISG
jgi:glycosyltransferase involved in cell wall biosynthesis